MSDFSSVTDGFANPGNEFSVIPFWFLNDELDRDRMLTQLEDFYSKGIRAIVPHPRLGIPRDTPYMGEKFLAAVRLCVQRASELGMLVVLYDEGMYPSGSACGLVARENPRCAARGIYAKRVDSQQTADTIEVPENEKLVAVYDVYFTGYED